MQVTYKTHLEGTFEVLQSIPPSSAHWKTVLSMITTDVLDLTLCALTRFVWTFRSLQHIQITFCVLTSFVRISYCGIVQTIHMYTGSIHSYCKRFVFTFLFTFWILFFHKQTERKQIHDSLKSPLIWFHSVCLYAMYFYKNSSFTFT